MALVEVFVPSLGESISEVEVTNWLVAEGTMVEADQPIVEVESEKATLEVPAPSRGVLVAQVVAEGEAVAVGGLVAKIDTEAAASVVSPATPTSNGGPSGQPDDKALTKKVMPAANRILGEAGVSAETVVGSGPGGRVLKEDAQKAVATRGDEPAPKTSSPAAPPGPAVVHRKRMSPLRRTIARRLVEAKQEMAMLTTFNEVDMSAVKQLRSMFGEPFLEQNGVKLGFMSFFVRAVQYALEAYPQVNSMIDGDDVLTSEQINVGVAIGGGKGLVVPILRDVRQMSMAGIEQQIIDFSVRAKGGGLAPEELEGGTFTISNGGVYGSMLSTPIINPPQSAILGLHAIKDRVVVVNGEMVIRPMMYLALSYDHRLIDGREAVSFLKSIKGHIEDPARMLLEVR